MVWFERSFARLGCVRGVAGVLELASAVAAWPYIVALFTSGPAGLNPVTTPLTSACALLVTLLLLIALRASLEALPGQPRDLHGVTATDPGKTLVTSVAVSDLYAAAASGLPGRPFMKSAIETHIDGEGSPASLGVVRFANYAPMVAFDAIAAGRVVQAFVSRLRGAAARRQLAQLDDDSFGVWIDAGSTDAVEAELSAIAYVLSQEIDDPQLTVAPDIHVGYARFPEDGDAATGLINKALASVVPLKRFAVRKLESGATSGDGLAERFAMEQALRRAVREGGLSLRYQPLVNTASGSVEGAEVLLRWRHPIIGDVSPALFVPLLEETALIHEIGLWTLNTACRQLRLWKAAGQPGIRLAINVSAIQLQSPTLKSAISRTVASHGLAPSDIELELTETAAMENRDRTVALFHELRELGFGIAIDDFGNGHSNFGYLKDLPFTKLKIDRAFVTNVDTHPGSQAICKALVELGGGLGISVLAEGVERLEEVATLRRLGCQSFQGYFFARPMTAEEFTTRLSDTDWLSTIGSDVGRAHANLKKRML